MKEELSLRNDLKMDDTITVYSNQDLRTLERGNNNLETLDMPQDELTGSFEYLIERKTFLDAYANWDRDRSPLLRIRDNLSRTDIYLGKPSADRVHEAIQKNAPSAQLF